MKQEIRVTAHTCDRIRERIIAFSNWSNYDLRLWVLEQWKNGLPLTGGFGNSQHKLITHNGRQYVLASVFDQSDGSLFIVTALTYEMYLVSLESGRVTGTTAKSGYRGRRAITKRR